MNKHLENENNLLREKLRKLETENEKLKNGWKDKIKLPEQFTMNLDVHLNVELDGIDELNNSIYTYTVSNPELSITEEVEIDKDEIITHIENNSEELNVSDITMKRILIEFIEEKLR